MAVPIRKVTKSVQADLDALPTVCKRVWYLKALGWEVADIARKLGITYHHAYNEFGRTAKNPR